MTPFVSVELSLMDILVIPSKPRASSIVKTFCLLVFILFLSCFFFQIYLITKGNTKQNKNSKKQKTKNYYLQSYKRDTRYKSCANYNDALLTFLLLTLKPLTHTVISQVKQLTF